MQTPITHEATAFPAVNAVDILRTLRAHGIEPDTVQQLRSGEFSIKFDGGTSRYWSRRVLKALPDAEVARRHDGVMAMVVVRV